MVDIGANEISEAILTDGFESGDLRRGPEAGPEYSACLNTVLA
jgi:hypothetical protein